MENEIINYKLRRFLKQDKDLIEKYVLLLKYLKPSQTKKKAIRLTLQKVEYLKTNINSFEDNSLIEIVKIFQGLYEWTIFGYNIPKPYFFGTRKVLNMKIIEFFRIIASAKKQIETIVKAEANSLTSSSIDGKWEAVEGSERMAKFGIYNTLDALSKEDILKHEKIMQLEYADVFTVLYMRNTRKEIYQEMDAIQKPK